MQKNSKNYKQQITNIAKTQITEAINIISFYLNFIYFFQFRIVLFRKKN